MWFRPFHPFYGGLLSATIVGLVVGAIVSIGFRADVIETPSAHCQEWVGALSVSNTCPKGMFIELQSDDEGGHYIVCHCKQPINVTIQMSPSQVQSEPDHEPEPEIPEVFSSPKSIEL